MFKRESSIVSLEIVSCCCCCFNGKNFDQIWFFVLSLVDWCVQSLVSSLIVHLIFTSSHSSYIHIIILITVRKRFPCFYFFPSLPLFPQQTIMLCQQSNWISYQTSVSCFVSSFFFHCLPSSVQRIYLLKKVASSRKDLKFYHQTLNFCFPSKLLNGSNCFSTRYIKSSNFSQHMSAGKHFHDQHPFTVKHFFCFKTVKISKF